MLVRNYEVDHKTDKRMEQIPFIRLSFSVSKSRLRQIMIAFGEEKNNRPGERKNKKIGLSILW